MCVRATGVKVERCNINANSFTLYTFKNKVPSLRAFVSENESNYILLTNDMLLTKSRENRAVD